jgi:heme-degrading monooxygenase HmoA
MFARVTLFEIDTTRIPIAEAERQFDESVVPRLRTQAGFGGFLVMRTPEGKGMVISLWESAEAAQSTVESGFYGEQVGRFITFMRQPPGREQYEVVRAQIPANAAALTGG